MKSYPACRVKSTNCKVNLRLIVGTEHMIEMVFLSTTSHPIFYGGVQIVDFQSVQLQALHTEGKQQLWINGTVSVKSTVQGLGANWALRSDFFS